MAYGRFANCVLYSEGTGQDLGLDGCIVVSASHNTKIAPLRWDAQLGVYGYLCYVPVFLVHYYPKGPYTAHLRTLVPRTIPGIVFGTRVLIWAVYGPCGLFVFVSESPSLAPPALSDKCLEPSRDHRLGTWGAGITEPVHC